MRLGWWSRLKFEPGRRLMAINHRALSGHFETFDIAAEIVDNRSMNTGFDDCERVLEKPKKL